MMTICSGKLNALRPAWAMADAHGLKELAAEPPDDLARGVGATDARRDLPVAIAAARERCLFSWREGGGGGEGRATVRISVGPDTSGIVRFVFSPTEDDGAGNELTAFWDPIDARVSLGSCVDMPAGA